MANKKERASLRIERHPRGHIASCNVPIESVGAKAEPCTSQYYPEDPRVINNYIGIINLFLSLINNNCY